MNNKFLTNKEKADEFLRICGTDENIKQHNIYKIKIKDGNKLTEDFDDFYTDTLIKCYDTIKKGGGEFPFPSSYKGYFYEALKNNYYDHLDKHRKNNSKFVSFNNAQHSHLLEINFEADRNELYERFEAEETVFDSIDLMKDVVDNLPQHLKDVINLHYDNKQSYKQIAKKLGISFYVVRNRLFIARQNIAYRMNISGDDLAKCLQKLR